jgi:hypothetical protein
VFSIHIVGVDCNHCDLPHDSMHMAVFVGEDAGADGDGHGFCAPPLLTCPDDLSGCADGVPSPLYL